MILLIDLMFCLKYQAILAVSDIKLSGTFIVVCTGSSEQQEIINYDISTGWCE
jgi:hypothetical protein